MSTKKIILILAALILIPFLYYTISPLFITIEVQDELDPEISALLEEAAPSVAPSPNTTTTAEGDASSFTSGLADETTVPTEAPRTVVSEPLPIVDTPTHPATGNVRIIHTPEKSLVRYENYDGTNGPALYVYLANDLDAKDFISLGEAKGNKGNINYTIPPEVDVDEYKYVMTWCRTFGVLFDYAEIN